MKKQILLIVGFLSIFLSGFSQTETNQDKKITKKIKTSKEIIALRKQHSNFLKKSPYRKTLKFSEEKREEMGIPPNKYFETQWELTMSPITGKPEFENLELVRKELQESRDAAALTGRTPGDASDNSWVERGPNNVGGRTRAVMFDPNDPTKETVFAGGVSGGIWKNTNISNQNSTWVRVGIPENLAVSCITYDPNNTQIFYVGTGESYTGDINGDGVWKSTNGGTTFTKVLGGVSGPTYFQSGIVNIGGIGNINFNTTTAFGTQVSSALSGQIVLVNDGTALSSEGCTAPLVNAAALNGKIALIRRGTCTFVIKVKNAQDAGAIGVIVMNNTVGPISMGGTDPLITIPSGTISQADGDALVAALAGGTLNGSINPNTAGFSGTVVPGKLHINSIKVRNNAGTSEVYVAVGDSFDSGAYTGGPEFGLYKSANGGSTWNEVSLPLTSNGRKHCPNDIEIGSDNKIWLSTTASVLYSNGGGVIFSSTDGITFTQKYAVPDGKRVQIAVSSTTPDKVYLLSQLNTAGSIGFKKTTNGFSTVTDMTLPTDADGNVPGADFTNGQSFYNLMIEVDPANDENVYTGGLDLFKTNNGGASWTQLSHWYGGFGYQEVHSDQHALAFAQGVTNKLVFGNDGGVFYSNDSGTVTTSRNKGYNVTQFYSVGVAPTNAVSGLTGDYFAAGAQDNGTNYFANAPLGVGASVESQGGDGAFCLFDQGVDKYYISNYVYNNNINYRSTSGIVRNINNETLDVGAFISPMVLDSNRDMLYSDYSTSAPLYQIRRYSNLKSGTVVKTILTNALLTGQPTAFAVSKYTTATTRLLVGTRNGKLLKLTSANTTPVWSDITGPAFLGSISDVEFGLSESEIFVTMQNYNVTSIWYSADGGFTWENKEGNFPDIPVSCILQNPLRPEEVIVGSDLGVWYTKTFNTATPVWNQSYNGMSNVKVTDLDLRNDNAVYASTYGRGVFSGMFTSAILSRDDVANTKGVSIYPNPSNGRFTLKTNQYVGKVNLQIVDINGRVVFNEVDSNFNNEKLLNLNNLQSGIYILKADGDNLVYTQKIIIE
jgi:hypothetical protein